MDETVNPGLPVDSGAPKSTQWVSLVDRIREGDSNAMDELYRLFGRGVRFYLCRQLGRQEVDDKVHDTFVIVVQAIQQGELREPDRLMGFVRTIAHRLVARHIDTMIHKRRDVMPADPGIFLSDQRPGPEKTAIQQDKVNLMLKVLRELSGRDRDILTRFYLYEQDQDQICGEMKLNATQFRLLKSRAKARFTELGRKTVETPRPPS